MTTDSLIAFLLAATALALVPGPTVTVIIANSLKHGPRAGLLNVLGTQAGVVIWLAIAALGLGAAIKVMGVWFAGIAVTGDTAYALLAGKAGAFLSQKRIRGIEIISGSCLVGGAAWMVLKGK